MKKLKVVGIVFLVLIALFLGFAATKPDSFKVERSTSINAPAENVFPLINDFHQWTLWSPWEKLDPNLKRTYDGPTSGVGATYAWAGNGDVGEGRMTINDSKPSSLVGIKLEFVKPFAATNQATFTLSPTAQTTKVVWTMEGKQNFMGKAMCVFMDMDKMVGGDFEKGLAAMKTVAEASAAAKK